MAHYSICVPAHLPEQINGEGHTFNIIVDIEHNRIELTSEDNKNVICLDLICASEFERTFREVVTSKDFQAALHEKISKHLCWYNATNGTIR